MGAARAIDLAIAAALLYTIAGGVTLGSGGVYLYPGVLWAAAWVVVAVAARRAPGAVERSAANGALAAALRLPAGKLTSVAIGAWCLAILAAQIVPLRALEVGPYELGIFHQSIWSIGQVGEPITSLRFCRSYFGEHFQPIIYLLAIPYRWVADPRLLIAVQTLAVGSGAWALLDLAARKLRGTEVEVLAPIVPLCYLAYAPLRSSATFNFHPEVMSTALFLWVFWARERGWWWLVAALSLAVMTLKEHDPLVVAGLGILFAYRDKRRVLGLALAAIGLSWSFLAVTRWIPEAAARTEMHHLASRYGQYGATPVDVAVHLLTHPWEVAFAVIRKSEYVIKLLAPLAFIPLVRPYWALAALPTFFMNVLASYPQQSSTSFQYTAEITPFLFVALLDGLVAVAPRFGARNLLIALLVGATLFIHVPETFKVRRAIDGLARAERILARLDVVRPDDPVSATPGVLTHLSGRTGAYLFPELGDARWVIVEPEGFRYRWHRTQREEEETVALLPALGFTRVHEDRDVVLWRRDDPRSAPGPSGRACPVQPRDPWVVNERLTE